MELKLGADPLAAAQEIQKAFYERAKVDDQPRPFFVLVTSKDTDAVTLHWKKPANDEWQDHLIKLAAQGTYPVLSGLDFIKITKTRMLIRKTVVNESPKPPLA